MAMTGMLIAAALAAAKNRLVDQPAADKKRKYEAATAAYSPWTGMKSQYVADPNALGDMIQYGAAGAALGSKIGAEGSTANLNNAAANTLNTASSPLGGMDMSAKLGSQATDFSKGAPSSWTGMDAKAEDPAWFYGNSPSKFSQPTLGSQFAGDPNDPAVKYKSILDRGLNPKNPEDSWTINPFKQNY